MRVLCFLLSVPPGARLELLPTKPLLCVCEGEMGEGTVQGSSANCFVLPAAMLLCRWTDSLGLHVERV